MSYRQFEGSEAPTAPERPGVLGYKYNNGGLNNQKMALISLMLTGIREKVAINLPYIRNLDQKTAKEYVVRIEDVFELGKILDFGRRHGLTILTECPSGERGGWDYFTAFDKTVKTPVEERDQLETILDGLLCLQPRIASTPEFVQLKNVVQSRATTSVQLRIEADWQRHAEVIRDRWGESEGSGLGYMAILAKVRKTFPELQTAYVTSDEKSMPVSKFEIRAVSRARFSLDLLWKSDILPAKFIDQLTPLDLSLVDFEISKSSPIFVGLTTSTFGNMVFLEKLAATRRPVKGHYTYNSPEDVVIEQTDIGFRFADRIEALLADDTA